MELRVAEPEVKQEGRQKTEQFHKGYEISHLAKFLAPALFAFDFFLPLFVFSSQITLVIVYCYCHFGNLHCIGWYILPKQHFVRIELFIIEVGGKLVEQAPVFLSFFSHFLTSQTPFEDDNLEDKWLNPLIP